MTLGEFKAFIEGMDIQDAPTPEQWGRIQKKLKTVEPDKKITTLPIPYEKPRDVFRDYPKPYYADRTWAYDPIPIWNLNPVITCKNESH